jgi:hypothetical protein
MATILAQQQRGPGLIDSGNVSVVGQVDTNTLYIFTALMRAADVADPTLSIEFAVFEDAQEFMRFIWTGGALDKHGAPQPPRMQYSVGDTLPSTVRFTANLPIRLSFGFDLTLGSVV